MTRTVAVKMGIKENSRAFFANVNKIALSSIDLPTLDVTNELTRAFDYIHLFVKSQAKFIKHFPKLKPYLRLNGMFWVSWPKGGKMGTDLNLKIIG